MAEKNVGKKHGLGVIHAQSFAPRTNKKVVKGSQAKAVRGSRGAKVR